MSGWPSTLVAPPGEVSALCAEGGERASVAYTPGGYPHHGRGMGGVGGARARRVADHRRAQGDYIKERGHSRRFGSAVAATWREGEMWVGKGWKLQMCW